METQLAQATIMKEITTALTALVAQANLETGAELVIGCSTSEIVGGTIGKDSAPLVGGWVALAVIDFCKTKHLTPIFQCCEHLNRALVMDQAVATARGYKKVSAVPKPKAGGSVAAAAWLQLENPVLVESVKAQAGMDIGDTLIGMHLAPVAVPFRTSVTTVGEAHLVLAYSRLPFIGGARAEYQ